MTQPGQFDVSAGWGQTFWHLMAGQQRTRRLDMLGRGGPHRAVRVGRDCQILQVAQRGDEAVQLRRCFDGFELGKSAPNLRRCIRHALVHTPSSSSVVVMVASSDSMLSMTALPYSVGIPATASRGTMTR